MDAEITTPHDELAMMIKSGYLFTFCAAFALNKGYRNALKEKQEVKFMVGDYEVTFDPEKPCFILSHKVYIFRIITAYLGESFFVGDDENEVINDLLAELEKEAR